MDIADFLAGIKTRSKTGALRISSISLWETAMLCAKARLKLSMPVGEWIDAACRMPGLSIVNVAPAIAADSAFLPDAFHGDLADRLITATARVLGAQLITLDQAILEYGQRGWVHARKP